MAGFTSEPDSAPPWMMTSEQRMLFARQPDLAAMERMADGDWLCVSVSTGEAAIALRDGRVQPVARHYRKYHNRPSVLSRRWLERPTSAAA